MSSSTDGEAERTAFMADGMLKRLSKWLRMMGYDVRYSGSEISDRELIEKCHRDDLVLLTRDHELYKSYERSILIRSINYLEQALQVARKFHPDKDAFFTRCPECNTILETVKTSDYRNSLPEGIVTRFTEVYRCSGCGKFYWNGTHYDRIKASIEKILDEVDNENNE